MAQTAEAEQTRLADGRAATELMAAAMAGAASAATYVGLGALWLTGHMTAATVATAALAIRTGSASLGTLVDNILRLHEESSTSATSTASTPRPNAAPSPRAASP